MLFITNSDVMVMTEADFHELISKLLQLRGWFFITQQYGDGRVQNDMTIILSHP